MKVSLCMIVKDEGKNLRRCLQSVSTVVDEIIIVDTGSTDNTCEIAREFGALVEHFVWTDSFGDARNRSLELATGDWVLVLDADEELILETADIMRRLTENQRVSGYFLRMESFVGGNGVTEVVPDLVFRLFKNRTEHRFYGAIHEQIADVILQHNQEAQFGIAEDMVIRHYGFLEEQIIAKDKKKRNLRLVQEHIQKNPDDQLLRYHYGVELYRVGKYEQAATEFIKAADSVDRRISYLPKLVRYVVICYYNEKKYDVALNAVKQGLEWFPTYADLYYYQGAICFEQKKYDLAYASFSKAVSMPEQPTYYASLRGIKGFLAYYHLGQIAELFSNQEEALENYILSLRDNAAFTASLDCICRILEPRTDAVYAKQVLEKICEFSTPAANIYVAELLMKYSAYSLAYEYLEIAANGLKEETATLKMNKAVCLMQQRQFVEAMGKLEEVPLTEELYIVAMLNKLYCLWLQGCWQEVWQVEREITAQLLSEDQVSMVEILAHDLSSPNLLKVQLGEEGTSMLLDFYKRTVVLGEGERAATLLAGVTPEVLKELRLPAAEICFTCGNMELAEGYINGYLTENSQNEAAYFLLAQVKERQGLYEEARDSYRRAMRLDPDNPKSYIGLAKLYDTMRQEVVRQATEKYQAASALLAGLGVTSEVNAQEQAK
ncbi:MAG: glycosyl transferase family 2 [Firmicutes bacterium]|nr:glycosyl transferase family 2 [Bacillota bacterium]